RPYYSNRLRLCVQARCRPGRGSLIGGRGLEFRASAPALSSPGFRPFTTFGMFPSFSGLAALMALAALALALRIPSPTSIAGLDMVSSFAPPAAVPVAARLAPRARLIAPSPTAARTAAPASPAAPATLSSSSAIALGADQFFEVKKRVTRRLLLRLFLVAPVATPQRPAVHDDLDGEQLLVVGPVLAGDAVLGMRLELTLHVFLEHALVIRQIRVAQDLVHLAQQEAFGELPGRLEAAVQVDRADDSFQRVRENRRAIAAARFVLRLAEQDEFAQAHHGGGPGENDAADQQRLHLGQLAFAELGKFVVEELVHREADDRVAEELHALVRLAAPPRARVEIRAVRHRRVGQRRVFELILENLFETFEIQIPVAPLFDHRGRGPVQTEQLSEQFHNVRIPVGILLRHIPRQRQGDVVPTKAQ